MIINEKRKINKIYIKSYTEKFLAKTFMGVQRV